MMSKNWCSLAVALVLKGLVFGQVADNADVRFVKSPPTPIVFVPVIPDPQDDVAILSLKGTEAK